MYVDLVSLFICIFLVFDYKYLIYLGLNKQPHYGLSLSLYIYVNAERYLFKGMGIFFVFIHLWSPTFLSLFRSFVWCVSSMAMYAANQMLQTYFLALRTWTSRNRERVKCDIQRFKLIGIFIDIQCKWGTRKVCPMFGCYKRVYAAVNFHWVNRIQAVIVNIGNWQNSIRTHMHMLYTPW